jgi:hypothetical protein
VDGRNHARFLGQFISELLLGGAMSPSGA